MVTVVGFREGDPIALAKTIRSMLKHALAGITILVRHRYPMWIIGDDEFEDWSRGALRRSEFKGPGSADPTQPRRDAPGACPRAAAPEYDGDRRRRARHRFATPMHFAPCYGRQFGLTPREERTECHCAAAGRERLSAARGRLCGHPVDAKQTIIQDRMKVAFVRNADRHCLTTRIQERGAVLTWVLQKGSLKAGGSACCSRRPA